MNDSKDHKAAAEPPLDCHVGRDTPRVDALIAKVMADFPAHTAHAEARYYDEVHQHLAPLARKLERENVLLRTLAKDAYEAWDNDMDARVGKLLRAMLDEKFSKTYRPDLVPNARGKPATEAAKPL